MYDFELNELMAERSFYRAHIVTLAAAGAAGFVVSDILAAGAYEGSAIAVGSLSCVCLWGALQSFRLARDCTKLLDRGAHGSAKLKKTSIFFLRPNVV